jgi:hypothetical protein
MGELSAQAFEAQVQEGNGQVHRVAEQAHQNAVQVQGAGQLLHVVEQRVVHQRDDQEAEGHGQGVAGEAPRVEEMHLTIKMFGIRSCPVYCQVGDVHSCTSSASWRPPGTGVVPCPAPSRARPRHIVDLVRRWIIDFLRRTMKLAETVDLVHAQNGRLGLLHAP